MLGINPVERLFLTIAFFLSSLLYCRPRIRLFGYLPQMCRRDRSNTIFRLSLPICRIRAVLPYSDSRFFLLRLFLSEVSLYVP